MSIDDTSQRSGCCEDRNVNKVLDGYPSLDSDHFVCGVPPWVLTASRGLFLFSGCWLAYFVTQTQIVPFAATLLLWIVIGLAVLVAMRPMCSPISFACDPQGVYFPSRKWLKDFVSTMPHKWLLVPWTNIYSINVQLLPDESGIKKAVTFCLRASDEERRVFLPGVSTLNLQTGASIVNCDSFLVGYPSAFQSPYKIVAVLSRFQRRETIHLGVLSDSASPRF